MQALFARMLFWLIRLSLPAATVPAAMPGTLTTAVARMDAAAEVRLIQKAGPVGSH